jgi:hypothetical protein
MEMNKFKTQEIHKLKNGISWISQVDGIVLERDCEFCKQTDVLFLTKKEILEICQGSPVFDLVISGNNVLIHWVCEPCKSKYVDNLDLQQLAKSTIVLPLSLFYRWKGILLNA